MMNMDAPKERYELVSVRSLGGPLVPAYHYEILERENNEQCPVSRTLQRKTVVDSRNGDIIDEEIIPVLEITW